MNREIKIEKCIFQNLYFFEGLIFSEADNTKTKISKS